MTQEPLTLYKLIVLYMLNKVSFPLTKAQVSDFILEKEYTTFLTLEQASSELTETGLVDSRTIRNRTHLIITKEGRETLDFFQNRISDAIKSDIIDYLQTNEIELRNEVSVSSNYYKTVNSEYEAALVAKDKDVDLISIKISVPTSEIAASICDNWQRKNQQIYQYLTKELF